MEKVGKLMNISVATKQWTTRKEMENHVSEMESKYYGGVLNNFYKHSLKSFISCVVIVLILDQMTNCHHICN